MPQTPIYGLPYPNANTDPPNGPAQIQALAQATEDAIPFTVGDANFSGSFLVPTGPSWNDILTVTGTSRGGVCVARFSLSAFNGNSGLDRTAVFRFVVDSGAALWQPGTVTLPLTGLPSRVRFGTASSTPGAGSHTWKLQGQASAANSVVIESAVVTVVEQ